MTNGNKKFFFKAVQPGNIGIVTTIDARLCEITGIRDGLIYCITLETPKITRICLPWHFWVLLDSL